MSTRIGFWITLLSIWITAAQEIPEQRAFDTPPQFVELERSIKLDPSRALYDSAQFSPNELAATAVSPFCKSFAFLCHTRCLQRGDLQNPGNANEFSVVVDQGQHKIEINRCTHVPNTDSIQVLCMCNNGVDLTAEVDYALEGVIDITGAGGNGTGTGEAGLIRPVAYETTTKTDFSTILKTTIQYQTETHYSVHTTTETLSSTIYRTTTTTSTTTLPGETTTKTDYRTKTLTTTSVKTDTTTVTEATTVTDTVTDTKTVTKTVVFTPQIAVANPTPPPLDRPDRYPPNNTRPNNDPNKENVDKKDGQDTKDAPHKIGSALVRPNQEGGASSGSGQGSAEVGQEAVQDPSDKNDLKIDSESQQSLGDDLNVEEDEGDDDEEDGDELFDEDGLGDDPKETRLDKRARRSGRRQDPQRGRRA
ncbi:hypothetical protein BGW38_008265 [Lunasporangiospora selenospora]|uniref:Uncharacterized protein n=1 Tax=Lunasporangiospora selenospora TaxID=979761 RepID=A0A9P6K9P5_9FUNG|nr:hypothetical protein BGW38_008265 [Lunasporangiospora selenospora]